MNAASTSISLPLLLLHGALGCREQMRGFAGTLRGEGAGGPGRRVLDLDFSGHGASAGGAGEFGIPRFAADIVECIDRAGVERVDVFGYSMGGYAALHAARRHPERFGRIMTLGTKFAWNPETAAKEASRLDPDVLERKAPAFAGRLREWHGAHWRDVMRSTASMMTALGREPALAESDFRGIPHTTLIAVGDRDAMVSAGETAATAGFMPAGMCDVLSETPHPFDQVDLTMLADRLRRFLSPAAGR